MSAPTLRDPEPSVEGAALRLIDFIADWAHECAENARPSTAQFFGFADVETMCRVVLRLAKREDAP